MQARPERADLANWSASESQAVQRSRQKKTFKIDIYVSQCDFKKERKKKGLVEGLRIQQLVLIYCLTNISELVKKGT